MANNHNIDLELLNNIADLISKSDLSEIEIEKGDLRVRFSRQVTIGAPSPYAQPIPSAMQMAPVPNQPPAASPFSSNPAPSSDNVPDVTDSADILSSPMIGTTYLAAEPGAAQFINEGSAVSEGQTVLIIEAMKTMNNIPAHKSGIVKKILVSNEQPVEFGQPLLVIE